jgi:hypothetical protein
LLIKNDPVRASKFVAELHCRIATRAGISFARTTRGASASPISPIDERNILTRKSSGSQFKGPQTDTPSCDDPAGMPFSLSR